MTALGYYIDRLGTILLQLACFLAFDMLVQAGTASVAGAVNQAKTAAVSVAAPDGQLPEFTPEENASYDRGARVFSELCYVCHGRDGKGAPILDDPDDRRMAPPLSGSSRILGRPEYVILALLCGITGPVDDETYEGLMVPMASYDDGWIADVASYVRNDFDNSGSMITSNQVARIRARIGNRTEPFTIPELLALLPVAVTNQSTWKVTASHNSEMAQNATAGASRQTAWVVGASQASGMWFQIELPEPIPICEINLDAATSNAGKVAGFPRLSKVQLSMDGREWINPTVEIQRRGPAFVFLFDPIRAKVIRIVSTSSAPDDAPWSISRAQITQAGQPIPVASGKPRNNAFE